MNIFRFDGTDFQAVYQTDGWKIGLLRYSKRFASLCVLERHLKTPEIFVLLTGSAVLYEKQENGRINSTEMQKNTVYEIESGQWHHITVSRDATVLVVENGDTCRENTEKAVLQHD